MMVLQDSHVMACRKDEGIPITQKSRSLSARATRPEIDNVYCVGGINLTINLMSAVMKIYIYRERLIQKTFFLYSTRNFVV